MATILNLPANALSLTPEIYAAKTVKKMWASPVFRMFTKNELLDSIELQQYGDFISAKVKPIVTGEIITDATSAIGAYPALNYGKVSVQLDWAIQNRYSVPTLAISVNNTLDYNIDGAEASGDTLMVNYETEVFRRIRVNAAIAAAGQDLGTVGNALNKRVFDTIRADADSKRQKGRILFVFLTPDKYAEAGNITEFVTLTNRNSALIDAKVKELGYDEQDYFIVPGNLNMVVVKIFNWLRPIPATDSFGFACFDDSILTPVRPVAPGRLGTVKSIGNMAITHTPLPEADQRIGTATNIKDEALCGFTLLPWDINSAGVTSGNTVWRIRGGN